MSKRRINGDGFTIIELMIATTVFGVMMLIASASIVLIGRQFYKGIISARTQTVAREVADEMTRAIQFTAAAPTSGVNGDVRSFCVAGNEYMYTIGKKLVDSPSVSTETDRALVRFDSCGAMTPAVIPTGGTELLNTNMRLVRLDISPDGTGRAWNLDLKLAHGDDDLLDGSQENCQTGIAGSQFCATSELNVTVFKRL